MRAFRRDLLAGGVLRGFAVGAALAACGLLVARAFLSPLPPAALYVFAAVPLCIVVFALRALSRAPSRAKCLALVEDASHAGGLILAKDVPGADAWPRPEPAVPAVPSTWRRALPGAIASLAALAGDPFERRAAALLLAGQLFGMTGDMLLIGDGFPFFAGGMGAFLIGHVCYITLFGGTFWRGMGWKAWAVAVPVMALLVAALVLGIGIHGALLLPMIIYGCALLLLIFSGLCGVVRMGSAWWSVLAGGVLFTFSDALLALRTFRLEETPALGCTIMATYIAAQILLAIGGIRLARKQ